MVLNKFLTLGTVLASSFKSENTNGGKNMENKNENATTVATATGIIGAAGTAGTLGGITAGLTAPLANLGGYATAQVVAGAVGAGGGPALSAGIAAIGGPMVAAGFATAGVGIVAAGVAYGVYKFGKWLLE
jgi:hypothetical protein